MSLLLLLLLFQTDRQSKQIKTTTATTTTKKEGGGEERKKEIRRELSGFMRWRRKKIDTHREDQLSAVQEKRKVYLSCLVNYGRLRENQRGKRKANGLHSKFINLKTDAET